MKRRGGLTLGRRPRSIPFSRERSESDQRPNFLFGEGKDLRAPKRAKWSPVGVQDAFASPSPTELSGQPSPAKKQRVSEPSSRSRVSRNLEFSFDSSSSSSSAAAARVPESFNLHDNARNGEKRSHYQSVAAENHDPSESDADACARLSASIDSARKCYTQRKKEFDTLYVKVKECDEYMTDEILVDLEMDIALGENRLLLQSYPQLLFRDILDEFDTVVGECGSRRSAPESSNKRVSFALVPPEEEERSTGNNTSDHMED